MDSIPFEDHKQLLNAAEARIADLEAENARLRKALTAIAVQRPNKHICHEIAIKALAGAESE